MNEQIIKERTSLSERITLVLILSIILIASTVLDEKSIPKLNTGFFSIHITDVLVIMLMMISISTKTMNSGIFWAISLLLFYAGFSAFYGIMNGNVTTKFAIRALRGFSFFFIFYGITIRLSSLYASNKLMKGVHFLALITAVLMIAQYILGDSVPILPQRVEVLKTDGEAQGVTRVLPPGQTLIFFSFTISLSDYIFGDKSNRSIFKIVSMLLIGFGVLITFNRSFWTGVVLAVLFLLGLSGFRKLLIGSMMFAVFMSSIIVFAMLTPNLQISKAITTRALTIINPEDTMKESSLQGRAVESAMAKKRIAQSPILGLGLGSEWRRKMHAYDTRTRYMHNGYYYILTKMGFVGFFFYLILICAIGFNFLRNRSLINASELDVHAKGCIAFLFAIILVNFVNPVFFQKFSIPLIAIAMGRYTSMVTLIRENAIIAYHEQDAGGA